MDKKTLYPQTPDVDEIPPSYNEIIPTENPNYSPNGEFSSSYAPSAPSVDQNEYTSLTSTAQQQYQQPNHVYYQTISMPSPPRQESGTRYIIRKRDADGRHFPINASIFLLGFIFPPLWLIGICWTSKNKYEIFWRKLNICMSILSTIVFILIVIVFSILIMEEGENRRNRNGDPSWEIPSILNAMLSYIPSSLF